MARSLDVTRVSSAAITSQPFKTSSALKEISRALPIGVARMYSPAAKSPRIDDKEVGDLPPVSKGLDLRVKGFSMPVLMFKPSVSRFCAIALVVAIAACTPKPQGPAPVTQAPLPKEPVAANPLDRDLPAYLRLPGTAPGVTPVRVGII